MNLPETVHFNVHKADAKSFHSLATYGQVCLPNDLFEHLGGEYHRSKYANEDEEYKLSRAYDVYPNVDRNALTIRVYSSGHYHAFRKPPSKNLYFLFPLLPLRLYFAVDKVEVDYQCKFEIEKMRVMNMLSLDQGPYYALTIFLPGTPFQPLDLKVRWG